jgi:signal transduction histidine kinase
VGAEMTRSRTIAIDELTEVNARLEATLEENARLHEQLVEQARASGVAEERGRLAREIHDTIAQGLAGIVTQLQAAGSAPRESEGWRRHHDAAMRLARDSLTEARRSVEAMRPESLEQARLPEALSGVVADWSALSGIDAGVTTTGAVRPMRPEIEVTLLRTAQEALANVAKHAGATRVGLTLSYMEDVVTLDVRDDGAGFVPGEHAGPGLDGGFGLVAMRQRLDGLSGRLEIESEPGGGTAISASMPAVPA